MHRSLIWENFACPPLVNGDFATARQHHTWMLLYSVGNNVDDDLDELCNIIQKTRIQIICDLYFVHTFSIKYK